MASEATQKIDKAILWEGGRSPFSLTYGKTMMWFFLVSDALTFGGLLIAYMFARHAVTTWPIPEKVFHALPGLGEGFPLIYVALMTFILIFSSVTMEAGLLPIWVTASSKRVPTVLSMEKDIFSGVSPVFPFVPLFELFILIKDSKNWMALW